MLLKTSPQTIISCFGSCPLLPVTPVPLHVRLSNGKHQSKFKPHNDLMCVGNCATYWYHSNVQCKAQDIVFKHAHTHPRCFSSVLVLNCITQQTVYRRLDKTGKTSSCLDLQTTCCTEGGCVLCWHGNHWCPILPHITPYSSLLTPPSLITPLPHSLTSHSSLHPHSSHLTPPSLITPVPHSLTHHSTLTPHTSLITPLPHSSLP